MEVSVHFITLRTRPDRRAMFEAWAKSEGPWSAYSQRAQVFVAEPHARGGVYGCWHSHMQVMRAALAQGALAALIFEDDAAPTAEAYRAWGPAMEEVHRLIRGDTHWDLIALGGVPLTWVHQPQRVSKYLMHAPFVEAHAYFASAQFMQRMVAQSFSGGLDYAMARRTAASSYVVVPELFAQNPRGGSNLTLSRVLAYRSAYKFANALWARFGIARGRSFCTLVTVLAALGTGAFVRGPLPLTLLFSTLLLLCIAIYAINEIAQDPFLPMRARMDVPIQTL